MKLILFMECLYSYDRILFEKISSQHGTYGQNRGKNSGGVTRFLQFSTKIEWHLLLNVYLKSAHFLQLLKWNRCTRTMCQWYHANSSLLFWRWIFFSLLITSNSFLLSSKVMSFTCANYLANNMMRFVPLRSYFFVIVINEWFHFKMCRTNKTHIPFDWTDEHAHIESLTMQQCFVLSFQSFKLYIYHKFPQKLHMK